MAVVLVSFCAKRIYCQSDPSDQPIVSPSQNLFPSISSWDPDSCLWYARQQELDSSNSPSKIQKEPVDSNWKARQNLHLSGNIQFVMQVGDVLYPVSSLSPFGKTVNQVDEALRMTANHPHTTIYLHLRRAQLQMEQNATTGNGLNNVKTLLTGSTNPPRWLHGQWHLLRGQHLQTLKQYEKAIDHFRSAQKQFLLTPENDSSSLLPYCYARYDWLIAQSLVAESQTALYHTDGQSLHLENALETCLQAAEQLPTLLTSLQGGADQAAFAKLSSGLFERSIDVAFMLDSLHSNDAQYFEKGLLLNDARKAISNLRFLFDHGVRLPLDLAPLHTDKQWLDERNCLQLKWTLAQSLSENSTDFEQALVTLAGQQEAPNPNSGPSFSLKSLQNTLGEEKASLMVFFASKQYIYTLTADAARIQFRRIDERNGLLKKINSLMALDTLPFGSRKQADRHTALSHDLYNALFGNTILENRKLIVMPDGPICQVPFDALVVSPHKRAEGIPHYLLFDKTISYTWSIRLLLQNLATAPVNTRSVIAFAPLNLELHGLAPLKGTPWHLRLLERQFKCKTVTKEETKIVDFKNRWMAKDHNISILATHTKINPQSGIWLYDGQLTIPEMYQQSSRVNLLVINSNYADPAPPNGALPFYLTPALHASGAASIIQPLWPIQRKLPLGILEPFYSHLSSGMQKDEALNQAKIDYLNSLGKDAIAASPHFWAGTILIGNTDPLYKASYLFPFFILLFFVGFWLAWRRRISEY